MGRRTASGAALFGVVLGACLGLVGRAAAQDDPETRALLAVVARDDGSSAWEAAVLRLKGGSPEARTRLEETLADAARRRHAAWRDAEAKVAALAAKVGEGRAADAHRAAWEQARASANEWIFDAAKFPVPQDALITGPRKGYEEAKKRGDLAIRGWSRLEPWLDRALAPAFGLSPAKAKALGEARDAASAAFGRVVAHLPEARRSGLDAPPRDPLAERLLRLRQFDLAGFHAEHESLPVGWRRLCLFDAWCRTVLEWNEARPFGMEPDALRGLRAINDYRRVLGISPVFHNERLARAARGHSTEMARMGYFSHRSPTPGRETKEQRAALEGYSARVVECITGAGGGTTAVNFWKYDGGHHRDMVSPSLVEGGFGTRGPAVYEAGAGEPGAWPVVRY